MVRILARAGLAASALIWIAAPPLVTAQSKESPADRPEKFIFLLPDGFKGWVCVDFGVAGAAPLPREGDAQVIRPRPGEVLTTSDKAAALFLYGEAWYEVNGQRRPLPDGVTLQSGTSRTGKSEPTERRCAFVGTIDERDAADWPPGFRKPFEAGKAIPLEERQALEALYKATDGGHWKHSVGWLGPRGSECNWHGVQCGSGGGGTVRILDLDLYENNLSGPIPTEIGQLKKLKSLNLGMNHLRGAIPSTLGQMAELESLTLLGNRLSGLVPDPLMQRWLAGPLGITAETPLLTELSEIDYEWSASAVLCARHRIILRLDGSAADYTERCRDATPQDRTTFCEVKEGQAGGEEFARLGWLIEKKGFFDLSTEYYRGISDAAFENTRVTMSGKVHAVSNYAASGPFELWIIQRTIEGVAASAEWEKTSTRQKCPQW
jgi:Leucine Rich Repeat (LRR) protein